LTGRIKARRGSIRVLCAIGGYDAGEWDLPPKPKWMRWKTYNQTEQKFDRYNATLFQGAAERYLSRLNSEG
jgi:hypothetical protein